MDFFKGKRVLISGASRGLGKDLVSYFRENGAEVYALSRNPDNLAKLEKDFPGIKTICADLSDWDSARKQVETLPPMDLLVNNAAVVVVGSFFDITSENFDLMMNTNVRSVLNVSQVVAKKMIDNGIKGSIVNVSSVASKVHSKGLSLYCTTKSALDMLTKAMCVELGRSGIRVNSVNPTVFLSDMSKDYLERNPDGGDVYAGRVPLKQIATSEEIVKAIAFLLSNEVPMINGQTILIDGGFTCT